MLLIISAVIAVIAILLRLIFAVSSFVVFILLAAAIILAAIAIVMKHKGNAPTKSRASHTSPFYSNENKEDEHSQDENADEDYDGDLSEEDDTDDASYDIAEDEIFIPNLKDDTLDDPFRRFVSKENDLTDELDDDSDAIYNLATDEESPIVMEIGDVFGISGRSAVLCGKLEYPVAKGDELNICREDGTIIYRAVRCEGIEKSHKKVDTANAGDSVGLLFTVDASPIERGMMIRG